MEIALTGAQIVNASNEVFEGERLQDLANRYVLTQQVIDRLSRTMDADVLRSISEGVALDLDTQASAETSALALKESLARRLGDESQNLDILVQKDERTERFRLLVSRRVHGNVKLSTVSSDFVHGADYQSVRSFSTSLANQIDKGSKVKRGDPEKSLKEMSVDSFQEAIAWLLSEAERTVSRQRYKGLGEMNPSQLWETTMDTQTRTLLRVQIDDAIFADQTFTTLMGDDVEPRRAFIESNALIARNIDV